MLGKPVTGSQHGLHNQPYRNMEEVRHMTKDSICKDYVSRKCFVYELKGVQREERSCNKMAAAGDASGDVKVLKCSEYERIQIRKKERKKLRECFS